MKDILGILIDQNSRFDEYILSQCKKSWQKAKRPCQNPQNYDK